MENKACRISDGPWKLPFKLIQEITNCFSEERKLGCGTFGQVYKGIFEDGEEIAVKMLRFIPEIDNKQFQNEFENLNMLKHQNIVQLVGFCDESEEVVALHQGKLVRCEKIHRALCLEYVPNGSLGKFLSGEYLGKNWPIRFRIIKGICEGVKYLHEGLEVPILHFDLKPDNILLDQDMVPKIADFGLSRLIGEGNTKRTMSPLGTLGYLPPEFINSGIISKEYDIFSLGVIIMKIIAGILGYSSVADMDAPEIIEHVYASWRRTLQQIPKYTSLEADCKQVRRCTEIAVNCMDKDRRKRPKIKDIVSKLDEIEYQESNSGWKMEKSLSGVSQTCMLQNMFGMPQNTMNNGLAQGASQDIYTAQRQIVGRQEPEAHNQLIYQQQNTLMDQNLHQNSLTQPHIQQQQSFFQSTQMQSSQQPLMQMSSRVQPGKSTIAQTQPMAMPQQRSLRHAQLTQKPNIPLQQNQLISQQDGAVETQQHQRLPVQSNDPLDKQRAQQMLNQQSMSLHQSQQFHFLANMSSLQQQQLLGTVPDVSNIQQMQMQQQTNAEVQQTQHDQQQWMVLMQHQCQQNQLQQSQQHIMPQFQSQPIQLQQLFLMLQQPSMLHKILTFASTLIPQNNIAPHAIYSGT